MKNLNQNRTVETIKKINAFGNDDDQLMDFEFGEI